MSITKMFSVDSNFLLEQFHVGRGCDKKTNKQICLKRFIHIPVFSMKNI